jgi:hypothetical protein
MKKLLVLSLVAAMAIFGTNAFADVIGGFGAAVQAKSGAVDFDAKLIPNGGAFGISGAGGLAAGQTAGGVAIGAAEGAFESGQIYGWIGPKWYNWGWKTITLGGAEGDLYSVAGGWTKTEAYKYDPGIGDKSIGVGSYSDNYAVTGGALHVGAWGLAGSAGVIGGVAGQGSLDASIIGPSPKFGWDSNGVSAGVAGQGSVGGFYGAAGTVLIGEADIQAQIDMWGYSRSESYRAIEWLGNGVKTETMGSNVMAQTMVTSYANEEYHGLATGFVNGGWVAGGIAASKTVQATPYGVAKAGAIGTYSAAGELGCNFNGSAVGYTQTTATQTPGYRGSIMTSQAGMQVSNNPLPQN